MCFQWARECAISTAAGDLFLETSVADIKGSIKDFSKAESIADKSYCSVQENCSAVSQEALETVIKKQPIHRFLDTIEFNANADFSLKQKK